MQKRNGAQPEEDRLLTPKQAAEILSVTSQTVKKYIYGGKLASVTTPGGHHRVRESDVRELLRPSQFMPKEPKLEPHHEIIRSLVRVIEELHDTFEPGHGERVANYARSLADESGMNRKQQDEIWLAGLLHDVGKLRLKPEVLRKRGTLTNDEFDDIKQHPVYGDQILGNVRDLQHLTGMIRHHHEREDGAGYPDGLAGEDIPKGAKILALAEAFDSMRSQAAYREALPQDDAIEELSNGGGTLYDADLTEAFVGMVS